jgi:hypothetical protein
MTFRQSIGVAALALAVSTAVPAIAQTSSSTSSQNSASAAAGKQVNTIRQEINKLTSDMARIRLKLRNDMLTKPEWASVVAAKKAADTNVEAARRTVLATLRTKEEYKTLAKERDDAAATVNAANAPNTQISDEDAKKAGDLMVNDGFAMKKMEMDMLKEDSKYTEAAAQMDSINAKMKELDGAVDLALKDDKDYQDDEKKVEQLKTSLASAQTALANARKSEEAARVAAAKNRQGGGTSSSSGNYR